MLRRIYGPDSADDVRRGATLLTVARLAANGSYRYAPPFLATVASGLDVSVATMGAVLGVSELFGLLAPWLGRRLDRYRRRTALAAGLAAVVVTTLAAAAARGAPQLGLALFAVGLTKMSFDMSVGSWIADRVPYATRGRVVGIVETSWAGSLLLVVPLMGLVTAAAGWRWAYVTASALVLVCVLLVLRLLPAEETPRVPEATARTRPRHLPRLALVTAATFGLLCASSQCVFVTVGPWLEDVFGVGSVGLAGVSALIGLCELVASGSTARLSDRVGKVRAAQWGALVMVPAAVALLLGRSTLALGLAGAVVVVTGFEFALVSTLPLATDMVPGAPAAGLGLVFFAGTVGRAVVSPSATALYSAVGMAGPAVAAAVGAALTAASYRYVRGLRA